MHKTLLISPRPSYKFFHHDFHRLFIFTNLPSFSESPKILSDNPIFCFSLNRTGDLLKVRALYFTTLQTLNQKIITE